MPSSLLLAGDMLGSTDNTLLAKRCRSAAPFLYVKHNSREVFLKLKYNLSHIINKSVEKKLFAWVLAEILMYERFLYEKYDQLRRNKKNFGGQH